MFTTLADLEAAIERAKLTTSRWEPIVVFAGDNRLWIAQRYPTGDCAGIYGRIVAEVINES